MSESAWSVEDAGRTVSVTIKYGKGYEETWVNFRGVLITHVREDIIDYFGLDRASVSNLTLSELVVNVTNLAHGKGNLASMLGATVIGTVQAEATAAADSVWGDASAQQQTAAPAANPMLAQILATTTPDELRLLWAENQSAFADAEVMAAWKTRGKALQQAAA